MKSLKRCSPGAQMDGTDTNDFRGGGGGGGGGKEKDKSIEKDRILKILLFLA